MAESFRAGERGDREDGLYWGGQLSSVLRFLWSIEAHKMRLSTLPYLEV